MKKLIFAPLIILVLAACETKSTSQEESNPVSFANFFIGSYTSGDDGGISIASLNQSTGELNLNGVAGGAINPSFIALSEDRLIAVNELNGQNGTITSYGIDRRTLRLFPIDTISAEGVAPCYITLDNSGFVGFVANYMTGNVLRFAIDNSGLFTDSTMQVQHEGSGPNAERQEGPHAHSVDFNPAGNLILAADLGIDQVKVYNPASLELIDVIEMAPGAGPRHFTFNEAGNVLYIINELDNTIAVVSVNDGQFEIIQVISTLPDDFSGDNKTADIHIHPSGKFLYGSNRGHDSIVAYRIVENGRIELIGWTTEEVNWPRNFSISPDGGWLLVANQNGNSINSYPITGEGEPGSLASSIETESPVCIKFYPPL